MLTHPLLPPFYPENFGSPDLFLFYSLSKTEPIRGLKSRSCVSKDWHRALNQRAELIRMTLMKFTTLFLCLLFMPFAVSAEESLRFEKISQTDAKTTSSLIKNILNQYSWADWGRGYAWSPENKDSGFVPKKRALFEDWKQGNGFEWIEPSWHYATDDLSSSNIAKTCPALRYKISKGVSDRATAFPAQFGMGPFAVYEIDSKKLNPQADKRYSIVLSFNVMPFREIANGEVFSRESTVIHHSAYLLDLKNCTYGILKNLTGSQMGVYTEANLPRLTAVGYRNSKIIIAEIVDLNPQAVRKTEIHATLSKVEFGTYNITNDILKIAIIRGMNQDN